MLTDNELELLAEFKVVGGPHDTSPLGTGDNWVTRRGGLPPYVREIAHALIRTGHADESNAIELAIGAIKRWARGGDKVHPDTVAKAQAALAQWEAMKGTSGKAFDAPVEQKIFNINEVRDEHGRWTIGTSGRMLGSNEHGTTYTQGHITGVRGSRASGGSHVRRVATEAGARRHGADIGSTITTVSNPAQHTKYEFTALNGDKHIIHDGYFEDDESVANSLVAGLQHHEKTPAIKHPEVQKHIEAAVHAMSQGKVAEAEQHLHDMTPTLWNEQRQYYGVPNLSVDTSASEKMRAAVEIAKQRARRDAANAADADRQANHKPPVVERTAAAARRDEARQAALQRAKERTVRVGAKKPAGTYENLNKLRSEYDNFEKYKGADNNVYYVGAETPNKWVATDQHDYVLHEGASRDAVMRKLNQRAGGKSFEPGIERKVVRDYADIKSYVMQRADYIATKTYHCKNPDCSKPATKGVLWAEGMAQVPVCDDHVDWAKDKVGRDEVVGVRDFVQKDSKAWSGSKAPAAVAPPKGSSSHAGHGGTHRAAARGGSSGSRRTAAPKKTATGKGKGVGKTGSTALASSDPTTAFNQAQAELAKQPGGDPNHADPNASNTGPSGAGWDPSKHPRVGGKFTYTTGGQKPAGTTKPAAVQLSPAQVAQAHQAMQNLGLPEGQAGISTVQREAGLPVTGSLDQHTAAVLRAASGH
jgi:hypothetical protein